MLHLNRHIVIALGSAVQITASYAPAYMPTLLAAPVRLQERFGQGGLRGAWLNAVRAMMGEVMGRFGSTLDGSFDSDPYGCLSHRRLRWRIF